jgi:hypothetical protein
VQPYILNAKKNTAFCLAIYAQRNCTPLDALKNNAFCHAHYTQQNCMQLDALKNSAFCPAHCAHAIGCTEKQLLLPAQKNCTPLDAPKNGRKIARRVVRSKTAPFALPIAHRKIARH